MALHENSARGILFTTAALVVGCYDGGSRSVDASSSTTGDANAAGATEPTDEPTSTSGDNTTGDNTTDDTTTGDTTTDDTTTDDTTTGADPDACGAGEWTCIAVEPAGPYGEHTFSVPAAQNWVNTGLYLEVGQQAKISESGAWFAHADEGMPIDHGPCLIGDFVARIGLHYKDPALTCVAGEVIFIADKPGILYVGALAGNDLGETYETRAKASGAKTATITSDAATVPTVDAAAAAIYPFANVASGWVELRGTHAIVTLPTATAAQDAAELAPALARLDEIYALHADLRGALPHHGQRIRFFPDADVVKLGWMLAGNPVRMDPTLVDAPFADRISIAGQPDVDVWGFAHEFGHDFTFVGALWWYQENSLESWPNIFTVHALEALGIPLNGEAAACPGAPPVDYAGWDAWSGLCFLLQFKDSYGWPFYADFFALLNTTPPAEVPGGPMAWHFVHQRFEQLAGQDVTPTFQAWGVPNPG